MNSPMITEEILNSLREEIATKMSEKRFEHSLGVERAAAHIGKVLLPERVDELRVAALLHDVTKEMDIDLQLSYIDNCELVKKQGRCPEQPLHSFSGAACVYVTHPELATEDILNAIMFHTLADPSMNMFAKIVFLADYIEDTRPYLDSNRIRRWLYASLAIDVPIEEKEIAFHRALCDAIDCTLRTVALRGYYVDPRTLDAKNAFKPYI